MDIEINPRQVGAHVVLDVSGEVDVHTAPMLDAALTGHLDEGAESLVLDLSAVEFLDSTGLGVLIKTLKRSREQGAAFQLVINDRISKVFRITGLEELFSFSADVDAAVAD